MMRFIKTTIVGGIVFLVPLIVILMVLGKAFGLMRKVSEPLSRFIPVESIAGVAVVDVLAVVVLLVLCFVAGMVAKSPPARRLYGRLDNALMVVRDMPLFDHSPIIFDRSRLAMRLSNR